MEKEFVQYQESFGLKQLGLDEPCFGYYEPNGDFNYIESNILKNFPYLAKNSEWKDLCGAPTYSQAFRWFRKKHQIVCVIDFYNDGDLWEDTMYTVTISEFEHFKSHDSFVQFEYKTYEEAELACLRKLIEIVKTKQ